MKNRILVLIAFLTIALPFALPYLASAQEIRNFYYEGFDGSVGFIGYDIFSWDSAAAPGADIYFQMRGAGVSDVWVGLEISTVYYKYGRTFVGVFPLASALETTLEYRVREGKSSWSYVISLSFD
ncbi:MAG: hypothetical protein OXG92_11055 [Chloroflexi bacterium]|nr:hypothetical protein [Chloroflexota bacterium]MCY3582435.1 hypothetical protein [Chloroflexota bacterium]MCY3716991.1 hypothetical protein [Chloroflexota bacterium]MDE2652087.1 hypothetical protein [Chloroflexota bacterium]MXX50149.1 hypothetical protein [Chloroflexota bacterium]